MGTARVLLFSCLLLLLANCRAPQQRPASRDRERAEAALAEGVRLLTANDYPGAEREFRAATHADPFFGPAYCNLGVALLKQEKDPYEAAVVFKHAAELMPHSAEPNTNLGILFSMAGQYGSAEERLREALRIAPSDIEIVGQLALLQVRRGIRDTETHEWLARIATQDRDAAWSTWARAELSRWPIHVSSEDQP